MTRDEWARIKAIADGALETPSADRATFLDTACGTDAALRREVEALLAAVDCAADLYEDADLRVAGVSRAVALLDAGTTTTLTPLMLTDPLAEPLPAVEFTGTDRYAVRRRLGAGGMGVVYEVEDLGRRQRVALKSLRQWGPADLYQLKREFRSLSDIAHPNLVSLYDLVVDDAHCFFTMELVNGATIVEYVGAEGEGHRAARTRRLLPQLLQGVRALHRHGKLHRDLKPSNILVTPDGRVVILDFGLTSSTAAPGTADPALAGTPAYVSPEQCRGAAPVEASDWYSVGATLYEALTGRLPFDGPLGTLLRRKTTEDAPPPRLWAPDLPEDLADVCVGLLDRDPSRRMTGVEALARLTDPSPVEATRPTGPVFVGRDAHLASLDAAYAAVLEGRHASVCVHGRSGIGKSALLEQFLERRVDPQRAVVLRGRCHEHESVPYKGLDGVVDDLCRHLRGLSRAERDTVMPEDGWALARLFPVLQGLTPDGPDTDLVNADPVAVRRRAFSALRALLARLAARAPLVVEIDDFHWADVESATALATLFEPPDPPPLLLALAFRSEEVETTPFLRAMLDRVDGGTSFALGLGPLTTAETGRLIEAWLPADGGTAVARQDIAREAGGSPFLVEQLARTAALQPLVAHGVTVEDLLMRQLEALPQDARTFLETLAVCGRPMTAARVFEACGLSGDERPLVAQLRASHLLRSSRTAGRVELYHDRIRETFAAHVPADTARAVHAGMADLLLAHGDDDPEALVEHYRGSGRPALAAVQAAAAAAKASAVLAFDRAASYFRLALDLDPSSDQLVAWTVGLAAALENAGRPVDAAEAYLDATRRPAEGDRLTWRRKAAELLLVGGRIDRGLRVSGEVLDQVGVRMARSATAALVSLATRRSYLRWRGLVFDTPPPEAIADANRRRIDAGWSITVGLAMVDPIRAAEFNVRQLLWALRVGDPYRAARALALEAGFSVIVRIGADPRHSSELSARAAALAGDGGQPYVAALIDTWAGIAAFLTGHWAAATERCGRAATALRDHCTGVTWELNLAQGFYLYSLVYRGELREAAARLPALLAAAEERGNVYLQLELSTRLSLIWLAADAPDEAERRANDSLAAWEQHGFQRPHYHHLLTLVQTRLYRGRARDAWELMRRHRDALGQSLFRRVQHTRVETAAYRARCALSLAAAGDDVAALRAEALREASRIGKEKVGWAQGFASLIRATVAFQEGHARSAIAGLESAIEAFERHDMALYANVLRHRLAALEDGVRAPALRASADKWFVAQDVRSPTGLARVLAPGFPD